jgi:hypothetical protein
MGVKYEWILDWKECGATPQKMPHPHSHTIQNTDDYIAISR